MKPLRFPSDGAFVVCAARGCVPTLVRPHGQVQAVDMTSATLFQVTDYVDREARPHHGSLFGGGFVLHNYSLDALGHLPALVLLFHGTDDTVETIQSFEPSGPWKDEMGLSVPELFDHFAAVAARIAKAWSENGYRVTTCFYTPLGVDSKLKIAQWRAGRIERTQHENALPFAKEKPMATPNKNAPKGGAKSASTSKNPSNQGGYFGGPRPDDKKTPTRSAPKKETPSDRFDELIDAGLVAVKLRVIPEDKRHGLSIAFATITIADGLVIEDWRLNWKEDGTEQGSYFIEGPAKPPKNQGEKWIPVSLPITANTRAKLTDMFVAAWNEAE